MMRPVNVEVSWLTPTAPTLAPATITADGVQLDWNDPTPIVMAGSQIDLVDANAKMQQAEIGFRIERSIVGSGNWDIVGTALANATSYTDGSGAPGESYLYRVTPWNEAGAAPSNEVAVLAPAKAPTGLTATVLAGGPDALLQWTPPNDPTVTDIVVERSVDGGAFTTVATLPREVSPAVLPSTWTDASLLAGVTYAYRVSSLSGSGRSGTAGPVTVQVDATSTVVQSSANPSAFGDTVTFTATVSAATPGVTPTGAVTFSAGGVDTVVDLDVNGVATLTVSTLAAGTSSVTAAYGGSPVGSPVTLLPSSGAVTQTVSKVATSTALESTAATQFYGEPLTFTATVAPTGATGTVVFTFDAGLPSVATRTVPVVDGVATYTTSTLNIGTRTVRAAYSGDANHASSTSATINQSIVATATTTSLTSSRNPAQLTQSVTFTATVLEQVSGQAVPAGVVTFRITNPGAADTVQTVAVDANGRAQLITTTLTAGSHTVTAAYNATMPWTASTSAPLTQTVTTRTSSIGLRTSRTPSVFGQAVTFTATMNDTTAQGTVTFVIDGTRRLSAVTNVDGIATVVVSNLAVGTHTVRAGYGGSAIWAPSTSVTINQVVNKAATTTRIASSRNPAPRGSTVTFTATVAAVSPGVGVPSGTVRIVIDGWLVRNVTLNSAGRATYSTSGLSVGYHTVTATYLGNGNFTTSTTALSPRQRIT